LPLEDHVRSAGGAAVLARLERLMLGEQRIPLIDPPFGMVFGGVNVDHPHARARAARHRDQRARVSRPPRRDDGRIGGRLVESAGAWNPPFALTGRIGTAPRDWLLVVMIDGKDRNAVLPEEQRSFAHAQRLGIDGDRLAHRRSKVGSARHGSRCLRGVGDGAAEFGGHGRGLPVPCAGPWKALHAVVPETASALFGAWWSGGGSDPRTWAYGSWPTLRPLHLQPAP